MLKYKLGNDYQECKNCENFNLYKNKCCLDGDKCYKNGTLLKMSCTNFVLGEYDD